MAISITNVPEWLALLNTVLRPEAYRKEPGLQHLVSETCQTEHCTERVTQRNLELTGHIRFFEHPCIDKHDPWTCASSQNLDGYVSPEGWLFVDTETPGGILAFCPHHASESVGDDMLQALVPADRCPFCGEPAHPYHEDAPTLAARQRDLCDRYKAWLASL